jgi:hypothetical protein
MHKYLFAIIVTYMFLASYSYAESTNETNKEENMGITDIFKKKKNENIWRLGEGSKSGSPILFRFRDLPNDNVTQHLAKKITIIWSYTKNNKKLPSDDDMQSIDAFEKALDPLVDIENSKLAYVITGNGTKKWVWYTDNDQIWMQLFQKNLKGQPAFPLELSLDEDKGWETYKSLRSSVIGI